MSLKEQLPGNPDGPGGPGFPGMPLLPPKQFTQVSPFSPETATKQEWCHFLKLLNTFTVQVFLSPNSLHYIGHLAIKKWPSSISHLSGPSLPGIPSLPESQGVRALREHNSVQRKNLEARGGLVDPGNLGVLGVQGDLAKKFPECRGLLSVLSLLGSPVFQADHHHHR